MSVPEGVVMSVPVEEPLRRVRMSWEEYLELPERPRAEWVDGEVVINVAPVLFGHGDAVMRLGVRLVALFPDHYLVTEVGLWLPHNRLRAPDLMLVAEPPGERWVREPPLLVVEVLSRSTRSEDTVRKSVDYARGGVGQYWVVDPEFRAIDCFVLVDSEWQLLARVDEEHPTAEVELEGVAVPLDLRQILRD